ncbi:MAG TPA: hypothetical protein VN397_02130, partial [Candidatus Methylomirabilis sp.]|nr:hypothetical protein [Candidatus Methylomirabilis sp.]
TYRVHFNMTCSIPYAPSAIPGVSDVITVRGNKVVLPSGGGSYAIDSNGRTQMTYRVSESGVSAYLVQSYQFTRSGTSGASVSGTGNFTFTVSSGGVNLGGSCKGTFSGNR